VAARAGLSGNPAIYFWLSRVPDRQEKATGFNFNYGPFLGWRKRYGSIADHTQGQVIFLGSETQVTV
jgi:hypothetical protein